VTVFQAVFDQLSALLASRDMAPGDRLPSERELAEQLQVSRPSVREALKALCVLGVVEVRGRATYVKSGAAAASSQARPPLALALADVELLEIQEFREAIESRIAALAAERAAPEDVSALEQVLAVMEEECGRDVEAFFAADRQFHRTLAEAAGNRLLMAAHMQIHEHELRQPQVRAAALHGAAVEGAMAQSLAVHRRMLDAVRQHDGARAGRLMAEHLAQMRQDIMVSAFDGAAQAEPTR
jgi:GntR family transcriptional repressor for pyruvate dehydrogenase complex